jgi:hypothetical protein
MANEPNLLTWDQMSGFNALLAGWSRRSGCSGWKPSTRIVGEGRLKHPDGGGVDLVGAFDVGDASLQACLGRWVSVAADVTLVCVEHQVAGEPVEGAHPPEQRVDGVAQVARRGR